MKKLVVRTVVITLASVIGIASCLLAALALFMPQQMAVIFESVGGYEVSVMYYENQYEKTGDIEDLVVLVDKTYGANDTRGAEKYLAKLINHKDFESFCSKGNNEPNTLTDKEYYYGYYALTLARNAKFSEALKVGEDFVKDNGYTKFNPLRMLVVDYLSQAQDCEKNNLKEKLQSVISSLTDSEQIALAQGDLLNIK